MQYFCILKYTFWNLCIFMVDSYLYINYQIVFYVHFAQNVHVSCVKEEEGVKLCPNTYGENTMILINPFELLNTSIKIRYCKNRFISARLVNTRKC